MEKKLRTMFDYQSFEQNPRLAKMIDNTQARYGHGQELDDDDLELVAAAGIKKKYQLDEEKLKPGT